MIGGRRLRLHGTKRFGPTAAIVPTLFGQTLNLLKLRISGIALQSAGNKMLATD
jgi:hypothetical protein